MKKSIQRIYYIIIPLLIWGITAGYTTFALSLLALLPLLAVTNRHTLGIFLVMYGGVLGGIIRSLYPIPIYGVLLEFLGLVLLYDIIIDLFHHRPKSFWGIIFVLVFFGLFFLIGPRDGFAASKYGNMWMHGIVMLFGYYAFSRSKNVEVENMMQILLLVTLCEIAYVVAALKMTPGSLFDFDWFRKQYMMNFYVDKAEASLIDYQEVGMNVAFAISIYLSQIRLDKKKAIFYVFCAVLLSAMSGARQAIFGVVLVIVMRAVFFREQNVGTQKSLYRLFSVMGVFVLLALVIIVVLPMLDSSVVSQTLEEGDSGRTILWLQAVSLFQQNPIFGVGLGGYHYYTEEAYPHNFLLELLCETGLFGVISVIVIILLVFKSFHTDVFYITNSRLFYFLIVLSIVARVLVSSDLTESIELFSAIFAMGSSNFKYRRSSYVLQTNVKDEKQREMTNPANC